MAQSAGSEDAADGELTKVDYAVVLCPLSKRNETPNPKYLQGYVINHYAEHWCSIAVELDINTATIEQDERECTKRLWKILEKWLNSTDASWKTLEVAITNVLRAQQHLDPVDDIYVTRKQLIQQSHDNPHGSITSNTTKSQFYEFPSAHMTMSLGRNTQQENSNSLIESRSLPASFVERSAGKQHQLGFCHEPQGDDLGPRKIHSDEEKHGQSSNPSKLYYPIYQPTDGTNSESADHPLSRHNQADPYVEQLHSQSTENQAIMESYRQEIVPRFNEMSLQQPCDSLSRLSQMDEPQESLPGLSSHNHTAQYQSHAVFPNHSGMPREVNDSTDQPQTGRPNNDNESSHCASQEPTSKVVFPTYILHQPNQPVALSSHIPQNFTPNENPSAPKHFTTPTSNFYTTESPDIEITSSTASIYHSLSHLNEEVQFQTTQPHRNSNIPLGQLSNSVKSNHQSCVARAPQQAKKGKCASNLFKLVTLGPSGSGKTSTVYSLLGKDSQPQLPSTFGADVSCTSTKDTIDRLYTCEWQLSELLECIKELATHHDNELKREKIKLLEETLKEVQDVLKDPGDGLKVIENEAIPEAKLKIVIYDIGRQEIYYDIQFLFLASQDVILLTFNASIGLDDPLTTEHCYEGFQTKYKIGRKETNFQAIKATLNAIYSYCGEKCDKSLSHRIPTVIMVATHAFGLTEEKKREIASTLFERLACSPLSDHFPKDLIDPIYFIDNKVKNPEAFEKLKTAAVFAAEFSTTEKRPISYLKFEEEILKTMSQKVYMITKEEALSIAKKVVSEKINDDALEELLQHCLHKGVLLHYPQAPTLKCSIFISPQMVSNLVSFVVKTHNYAKFGLTADLRKKFIRFDKFGLLEESLLDDMLERSEDSNYTKERILGFLETFNLAVEVDRNIKFENEKGSYCTPDSGRVFFVPSVLVYNKSKDYLKPNDHIDNVVLFHFPDEFLPSTVFNYLLILTIQSSRENGYSIRCIHHGIGVFDFINDKQCFTLQHCPKTHSIKCCICVHQGEVNNAELHEQRWKLLQMLDTMIHSIHKCCISTAQKPIAYIECPLQHDEECGLHLHLHKIKLNMYCNKMYPKQLVPRETYNLLLPMDQLDAVVPTQECARVLSPTSDRNLWTQDDLQKKAENYFLVPLPKNTKDEVLRSITILLVSTNENETLATRSCLRPLDGHKNIYKFDQDGMRVVYYIGKYGACPAAVAMVPQGFEVHISTLANQYFPYLCAIVSVGVACGIEGKVQMCDVLVSSQIFNYDKDDQIPKEKPFSVSPWLKKLFSHPVCWPDHATEVRLTSNGMQIPNVMSGVILSWPSYHSNDPMMKNFATNIFGEAIGIEIQRAYHFTKDMVNVIVVKAVCDFGDWMDNIKYEPTAAFLAADMVHVCLSDHQTYEKLKGKVLLRQMLQEAKNEGLTINVRHAKVLFCGAAKAGKTSFSDLLRSEEHNTDYKSTPAGNAQQVLISDEVNVVDAKWVNLDSKLETQQVTNRLIAKLQTQQNDKSPENHNVRRKFKISTSGKKEVNYVTSHQQTVTKATCNSSTDAPNSKSRENIPENNHLAVTSDSHFILSDDEIESLDYSEPITKQITTQEQMIMSTDIVNAPVSELESIPETWDLFTFLDTGGQPEFINMLPAINSSTAITFVVMNISDGKDCLNSKVVAQYQHEGYNYDECTLKYTNMHLLKCLFSSVKVAAVKRDYFNLDIVKRVTEDEHPTPVIYIIGTCADVLKERFGEKYNEEVLKIDEEVTKLVNKIKDKDVLKFQCKCYNEKFVHVIPVDNTVSRGLQEEDIKCETAETVQSIREQCNTILQSKAQYEIPISWFILELELRNNDKVCIPLAEVKTIYDKIMPLHRKMKMKQIKEILKFYHTFGMLLYFSEVDGMNKYVITNPQWLFLNLTKIIMCKFVNNANSIYDADIIEEMNKGICSLKLLTKLDLNLQGIKLESFVKLLVHLKVIAPVSNAYFMPTILPPCSDENIFTERECGDPAAFTVDGQCIHSAVEPLLIQFTSGIIPRGLFGFLIVQLLQDNPDTYELYGKNDDILRQCSDLLCFYVKPYWYVSLRDKIFYLELQVHVMGNEPSYHYKALTIVSESLKKVCDEFNWQFSDCRYGFLCHEHTEDSQDDHQTLLPTNPPYKDKIPEYAICCNQKPTHLSNAHTIWFKDVEKISKLLESKGTFETYSYSIENQPKLSPKPTYTELIEQFGGVVHWKKVGAFLLSDNDGSKVEIIERNNHYKIEDCRIAMVREYFKSGEVTWNKVLEALTKAGEKATVDRIRRLL